MMDNNDMQFILERSAIENVSECVADILSHSKIERKNIIKIRLFIEDLMLRVLNNSDTPRQCSLQFLKRLGTRRIRIVYDGMPYNPLAADDDEYTALLLENLGIPCKWKYNNTNSLEFQIKKRDRSVAPAVLAAVIAAALLGYLDRWVPGSMKETTSAYLLTPFRDSYLGLMNAMAGLLIFFNIIAGLCGDKGTEPLGKKSGKMLLRLPLMNAVMTAAGYLVLLLISRPEFGVYSSAESQTGEVIELLWGIIPRNVLLPFVEGNHIQVMILAMAFGFALSVVRDRYSELVAVVNGINEIVMSVTKRICQVIPLFVFCCLLLLIRESQGIIDVLKTLWVPVVLFLAVSAIISVVVFIILSLRWKCNGWRIWKSMLPALLISLTTGSPMAAYSMNIDLLENRFGVSKKFSILGLSLSGKLYGPGYVIYLAVMVLFFADRYGIAINYGWIATAVVLTVLLSFASPPIPGALLIVFSVFSRQFGFPEECLAVLAVADILLDGPATAVSTMLRNAELIFEAGSLQELDKAVLQKV